MGKFHDTLTAALAEGYDGDLAADLTAAYDEDLASAVDLSSAKITELTETLTQRESTIADHGRTITGLKAEMHDLSKQIPVTGGSTADTQNSDSKITSVNDLLQTYTGDE